MKKNRVISLALAMVMAVAAMMPMAAFAEGGNGNGGGKGNGDGSGNGGNVKLEMQSSMPADGDTEVSLTPEIQCVFSHNVTVGELAEKNLALVSMETEGGTPVEIETWVGDAQVDPALRQQLFLKPVEALTAGTTYVVRLGAGIEAKNGMKTEAEQTFSFTTAAEEQAAEATAQPVEQPTEQPTEQPAEQEPETPETAEPVASGSNSTMMIVVIVLVVLIAAGVVFVVLRKKKQ